jgi:hypothetical protein
MDPENIIPEAVIDASQLNAPVAEGTVGSQPASSPSSDGLTLAELNATLGKNFPTKEAALKSFKDTFSYVGKKIEDVKREVLSEVKNDEKTEALARELQEMRIERFYDKNPQYADASIRKFIESTGKSPAEVVSTPEFKAIFDKVAGFDQNQKLKTVLESNPRLNSSRDSLSKARELQSQGLKNSTDAVESLVAQAVIDAYDLK